MSTLPERPPCHADAHDHAHTHCKPDPYRSAFLASAAGRLPWALAVSVVIWGALYWAMQV